MTIKEELEYLQRMLVSYGPLEEAPACLDRPARYVDAGEERIGAKTAKAVLFKELGINEIEISRVHAESRRTRRDVFMDAEHEEALECYASFERARARSSESDAWISKCLALTRMRAPRKTVEPDRQHGFTRGGRGASRMAYGFRLMGMDA